MYSTTTHRTEGTAMTIEPQNYFHHNHLYKYYLHCFGHYCYLQYSVKVFPLY